MVLSKLLMTTSAAFLALAGAASAATYSGDANNTDFSLAVGDFFTGSANIEAGDEITYNFDVTEDFLIENFVATGSGYDSGDDLMRIRFGYGVGDDSDLTTVGSWTIRDYGSLATAEGEISGRSFSAGDSFFFTFMNNGDGTDENRDLVGTTVSFEVAPIPVPAAGFLLLGALGAGALMGRRKKAA